MQRQDLGTLWAAIPALRATYAGILENLNDLPAGSLCHRLKLPALIVGVLPQAQYITEARRRSPAVLSPAPSHPRRVRGNLPLDLHWDTPPTAHPKRRAAVGLHQCGSKLAPANDSKISSDRVPTIRGDTSRSGSATATLEPCFPTMMTPYGTSTRSLRPGRRVLKSYDPKTNISHQSESGTARSGFQLFILSSQIPKALNGELMLVVSFGVCQKSRDFFTRRPLFLQRLRSCCRCASPGRLLPA